MLIYRRQQDQGKYVVYEVDFVMHMIVYLLFLLFFFGFFTGTKGMGFPYWAIIIIFYVIESIPFSWQRMRNIYSAKKMKKEGSFFSTEKPLTLYFEK